MISENTINPINNSEGWKKLKVNSKFIVCWILATTQYNTL